MERVNKGIPGEEENISKVLYYKQVWSKFRVYSASMYRITNPPKRTETKVEYSNDFLMYWINFYFDTLYQRNDNSVTRMKKLSLNINPFVPPLSLT